MKTKTMLVTGFSVAFILLVIISATALLVTSNSVQKIEKVVNESNLKIDLISQMRIAARERTVSLQKMIIMKDVFDRDAEWINFNRYGGLFADARMQLLKLPLTREENTLLYTQGKMTSNIAPLQTRIAEMIIDDNIPFALELLLERAIPGQDRIFEVLTMLGNLQRQGGEASVRSAQNDYSWAVGIILIFAFTVGALFVFIAMYTIQKTSMAEHRLREEKERVQTTLYSIADGVVSTDANGIIIEMNEVAQKLCAWQSVDAIGQPVQSVCEIVEHSGQKHSKYYFNVVFKKKRTVQISKQMQLRQKDGQQIYVEGTVSPIVDAKNNAVGAVLVFRDVSARIRSEQELKIYKDNLELIVDARTKALSEANRNLEIFSNSISHDLRAPLRSINGFSHALMEDYANVVDDQGKDFINRIRTGTERIGALMDDLLKLSRVSSGIVNRGRIDLSSMANEIVSLLEERSGHHKIDWKIKDGLNEEADESLMWVLLEHLLENAWKYTSKTETASVEFSSKTEDDKVIYYVKDNGVGFDMNYYNKLFGSFERLHHENQYEGSGIGLATVKKIVQRHGGKVWADGEMNKGATFYFTINSDYTDPIPKLINKAH